MKKVTATLAILLLCGCCTKRASVEASSLRHADSVAELSSLRARTIERETVLETVRMVADSSGRLHVVSRDVTRFTDRGTERVEDTTRTTSAATASSKTTETTGTVEPAKRSRVPWACVLAPWLLLCLLVTACAFLLVKKGKEHGS